MKTPPLLLGAALLFWGWQTDFLIPGAIMAVVLEGSRLIKARWDLGDDEFKRIWTFCALLFLAGAVYAFTDNSGPENFGRLFQGPSPATTQQAGSSSARTAAALIRWLPMIFILFVAAQVFSARQEIPLHTISLILQRRWKQAKKLGQPPPATRGVDVTYPYFALCIFAASIHHGEDNSFFWGLCVLLAWALWLRRPRRFGVIIWVSAFALAILLGYSSQHGLGLLRQYIESQNPQWLVSLLSRRDADPFQSQTKLGQIGQMKLSPKIVIRVEPKSGEAPTYLREASYATFVGRTWSANNSTNEFTGVPSEKDQVTWIFLPEKTNAARVGIACYLEGHETKTGNPLGVLPLPSGSTRLENLSAYVLQKNNYGAVLAEGPGLVRFDALYGPGATIDAAPNTNALFTATQTNLDLLVPTNEIPALDNIVSELHLQEQTKEQAVRTIANFFQTQFTYRTWQNRVHGASRDETPLTRFLLRTRAGHCEYFATATVLLLREIGIPARYAVGYAVHEQSGSSYVVRLRDAHAWCLVWDAREKVWRDFDTTPASWVDEESKDSSRLVWLSDALSWVQFQFAKFRWGQTHMREYLLLGLVPVLVLLLFQIIRKRRRQRSRKGVGAERSIAWPGLDSEFYQIEKQLARHGIVRGANEPLADWLERAAAEPAMAELKAPLRELLRLHYRYRFDPEGLSEADREELRREARECLEKLAQTEKEMSALDRISGRA